MNNLRDKKLLINIQIFKGCFPKQGVFAMQPENVDLTAMGYGGGSTKLG